MNVAGLSVLELTFPAGATLTQAAVERLRDMLSTSIADPGVKVIALQGGPNSFCAGLDLGETAHGDQHDAAVGAGTFFQLLDEISAAPLVTVALVDGPAHGGGVGLASACDIVIASDDAQFGLPEAMWGLIPCCVLPFLERRVGQIVALRMALTTLPIDADEAQRVGLADLRSNDTERAVAKIARRLEFVPRETLSATKAHARQLTITPDDGQQELATLALSRRLDRADVRDRLTRYVTTGETPWSTPMPRPRVDHTAV